jgi:hypothetical protein
MCTHSFVILSMGFRFTHKQPALSELAMQGSRGGFTLDSNQPRKCSWATFWSRYPTTCFTVTKLRKEMRKVSCIGEPSNMQATVRTLEKLSELLLLKFLTPNFSYEACGVCLSLLALLASS